jgi:hypothetical protein
MSCCHRSISSNQDLVRSLRVRNHVVSARQNLEDLIPSRHRECSLGASLLPGPWYVQWGAFLILLPGLAYIAYHGIEKRGIAVGNRVALSLSSKQTPPALLSQAR